MTTTLVSVKSHVLPGTLSSVKKVYSPCPLLYPSRSVSFTVNRHTEEVGGSSPGVKRSDGEACRRESRNRDLEVQHLLGDGRGVTRKFVGP